MNNAQRKQLNALSRQVSVAMDSIRRALEDFTVTAVTPGDALVKAHVGALRDALTGAGVTGPLEEVRDEEQDKYDNMPESLQNGANGERMQTAIEALESAIDTLETTESELEQGINDVENATTAEDLVESHGRLEELLDGLEEVTNHIDDATNA